MLRTGGQDWCIGLCLLRFEYPTQLMPYACLTTLGLSSDNFLCPNGFAFTISCFFFANSLCGMDLINLGTTLKWPSLKLSRQPHFKTQTTRSPVAHKALTYHPQFAEFKFWLHNVTTPSLFPSGSLKRSSKYEWTQIAASWTAAEPSDFTDLPDQKYERHGEYTMDWLDKPLKWNTLTHGINYRPVQCVQQHRSRNRTGS